MSLKLKLLQQSLEICVPVEERDVAISLLDAQPELFERQRDEDDADFYHPYKQGAAIFKLQQLPYLQLYVIPDELLLLDLRRESTETSLTRAKAHAELRALCDLLPDSSLQQIAWPSLRTFIKIWLLLGARAERVEHQVVYMSWADRLFCSNNVDLDWCLHNVTPESEDGNVANVIQVLLRGRGTNKAN